MIDKILNRSHGADICLEINYHTFYNVQAMKMNIKKWSALTENLF